MKHIVIASVLVVSVLANPATADVSENTKAKVFVDKVVNAGIGAAEGALANIDQLSIDADIIGRIVKRLANRTRRAIAIGPHVGAFGAAGLSESTNSTGASFGLGLYYFDVPSIGDLRATIEQQIKARLKGMIKDMILKGQRPPPLEVLIRETADAVIADLLGDDIYPKLVERSRFSLVVEGATVISPDSGFQGRITFGMGAKVMSLGFSMAMQYADGNAILFLGPELGVRLTPIGKLRTPVVDLFARAEFGFDDSTNPVLATVGARLLLDLL